ncbi:hypothetical protein SAMN06298216_0100 [Spirosomataceae bacterium TFI 002]|nr:hypothetical protein SAMN06298216_0100 [Spirosomataceae bacterium TFI 002]
MVINKKKILNDPVYGFVKIPNSLAFDIIQHPYFQRLRRIKQLGLAELVYPGAIHTRFQHAIGAMHLMDQALDVFQAKGVLVMEVEKESALAAILLHDIGHGPFSHVLEYSILDGIHHEKLTLFTMQRLNKLLDGRLDMAIQMFRGTYHRKFYHQLISSQLDMDRMDYIKRDSFFSGVDEGSIGVERLIKMLNVVDDELVVEEKGLLSVENFLNARRLMYWQVYLHKTSICAEALLLKIIERARDLITEGKEPFLTDNLGVFMRERVDWKKFNEDSKYFNSFMQLDDFDLWGVIKVWSNSNDEILATLSSALLNRQLFKMSFIEGKEKDLLLDEKKKELLAAGVSPDDLKYFYHLGDVSNAAYVSEDSRILIDTKKNGILDVSEASDLPTIKALSTIVKKSYLCWFNDVYLQKDEDL